MGPGSVIAGRYRLDTQLGQGGMGSVWRAEHLTLRSPVAIKLIDPEIAGKAETLERFQAEAQAAAALRSPHVVQILDYGIDPIGPFIVMELLEGESLSDRLARLGRLPHADVARFVLDVARALTRAHEAGVVHRDLKPDNVFLVRNDDHDLAKVLDFGIAKTARPGLPSAKGPTRTGVLLGTPGYMSPEQAQGTKVIDARSDLWSLGVIAYECVVGRPPFESEALGDLLLKICVHPIPAPSTLADVPAGFDAWFARACCRDVAGRFQTARELAETLRIVLAPDLDRGSASLSLATLAAGPPGASSGVATVREGSAPKQPTPGVVPVTTVPGLSLATASRSKRATGAYVAAGLGLVLLGSGGTWLALSGKLSRRGAAATPAATAAMIATALPSGTLHEPPRPAALTVETEAPTAASPPSVTPGDSVSAPAQPAPSVSARVTKPQRGAPPPPSPSPPPRRSGGGGDQRLGF